MRVWRRRDGPACLPVRGPWGWSSSSPGPSPLWCERGGTRQAWARHVENRVLLSAALDASAHPPGKKNTQLWRLQGKEGGRVVGSHGHPPPLLAPQKGKVMFRTKARLASHVLPEDTSHHHLSLDGFFSRPFSFSIIIPAVLVLGGLHQERAGCTGLRLPDSNGAGDRKQRGGSAAQVSRSPWTNQRAVSPTCLREWPTDGSRPRRRDGQSRLHLLTRGRTNAETLFSSRNNRCRRPSTSRMLAASSPLHACLMTCFPVPNITSRAS